MTIFISEYVISLMQAVVPHQRQDSLQAGFATKSGLESNALVLVMGADTDR